MGRTMTTKMLGAVVALAAMAVGCTAPPAEPDPDEPTGPKTYTVSTSPTQLDAGPDQQATIVLTNTSPNNISFDAANIGIPDGLQVANPTVTTSSGPKTVQLNTSVTPNRFELRGLQVGNTSGQNTATLQFTITSPVPASCSQYDFATDVRQSNKFLGTFNRFTRVGADATFSTPCNAATVTCTAGDSGTCSTGTIVSESGAQASVTVEDDDTLSATLTASLDPGTIQCDEYTAASDQLFWDIIITNGASTAGLTKTVSFSSPVIDARQAFEYQVCFQAPFDFPAFLPSQLLQDFTTGDFSGNTQAVDGEFRGLLLPCTAGKGVPCVAARTIDGGRINVSISTSLEDPRARF